MAMVNSDNFLLIAANRRMKLIQ